MKPLNMHDLSVVIPARNESRNLALLLPQLREVLDGMQIQYELIIVDELADEETRKITQENQAVLLTPPTQGYGAALQAGFHRTCSDFVLTMDADFSHPPTFIRDLWAERRSAEVIIASRYCPGGKACMPAARFWLSKILNTFFSRGLDFPVRDMSSGYRLYAGSVLRDLQLGSRDFDILQEVLVKALVEGYRVREIPFEYQPRKAGSSHARVLKFGMAYLQTFRRLWKLRNSIASADYDARAYVTLLPPQRYWQRQRYKIIVGLIRNEARCLDVGCGSSRIIGKLPGNSIALDILARKLRYARRYEKVLLQGSGLCLPLSEQSFPCVVCSQVIEHIPRGTILEELDRVLEPGGLLVLGTPDYDHWQWRAIERIYKLLLPQAYADEHITHYTYAELEGEFVTKRGYSLEEARYILQGELIMSFRKPALDNSLMEGQRAENQAAKGFVLSS
jgi:dolichol-phosphate mannosyltransferase